MNIDLSICLSVCLYLDDSMSSGMQYPFGQLTSAVLILFPPSFLCPFLRTALVLSLYNTAYQKE